LPNFDICEAQGPDTLTGVERGYIHSPNFPAYYGNSRHCGMGIQVPANKYLAVYIVSLSIEGRGRFSSQVKDFLAIDGAKIYGHTEYPLIVLNQTGVDRVMFEFSTDWITLSLLSSPKGFLVYFECKFY
jgi:hypothetical protein